MATAVATNWRLREYDLEQFDSWRPCWAQLAAGCFMQHPAWLINAWTHFHRLQPGTRGHALLALHESPAAEELLGCSAWFQQFRGGVHWWRAMGSGQVTSDYLQMPCKPEAEAIIGRMTADWFARQAQRKGGLPVAIEVEGHRPECSQWRDFFDELARQDWLIDSVEIEGTWRLAIPRHWADYEAMLPKTLRHKCRRAIQAVESGAIQHQIARTPAEIESAWPTFVQLHQQRAQPGGASRCFSDSDYERFLRSAVDELAQAGVAWLSTIWLDDQPLASLLLFDSATTTFMYQSGIDAARMKQQPGHLANCLTIREVLRQGKQWYDFLRGDEAYKPAWRAERSTLHRTLALPPGWAGRGISSALKLRRQLRGWHQRWFSPSLARNDHGTAH